MSDKEDKATGVAPPVVPKGLSEASGEPESELSQIDKAITSKHVVAEQTDRLGLLRRLMEIYGDYPLPDVVDVVVRALELEVWHLSPERNSDMLMALIAALNQLQFSYTRLWAETSDDEQGGHIERADRLEAALRHGSYSEDERAQAIFAEFKGLPFGEIDSRWDVLYECFPDLCYKVQFAISYGICINATADTRHPMFDHAIRLVADAAVNNDDRVMFADALIALRCAQGRSVAAASEEPEDLINKKYISRFA